MNIQELKVSYDRLRLSDIIGVDTTDGKWDTLIQSICQCPVIRKETNIVYQQLGAVCACLGKQNSSAYNALSVCTAQDVVRAVECVSAAAPESLPAGLRELEETAVFAELVEAWGNAEQSMVERYMAIMTALQACYYLTVEKAPQLEPVVEQVLENIGHLVPESPAEPAPAPQPEQPRNQPEPEQPADSRHINLSANPTFEELKTKPFGKNETLFDVYVNSLDYAIKALEDAQNHYDQIDPNKNKPYKYLSAIRFLEAVDRFRYTDTLLSMPIKVNPRDGSVEACKYRQVVPDLENSKRRLEMMQKVLEAKDPDLQNKYQLYTRFSMEQEDLSTPVANKAQLLFILPDDVTYQLVEERAEQLRELAEKFQYPHAYVLATKLYLLALGSREREAVEENGMYLSAVQCQLEITESLAEYYYACHKKGKIALNRCEAFIFGLLQGMYSTSYNYLQDLQAEVLVLAEETGDMDAALYFLQLMDRYLIEQDALYKKRQMLKKQYSKLKEIKPRMATVPAVGCFAGIFLPLSLLVPLLFLTVPTATVAYISLVAALTFLLFAQVRVMRVHPEAKWWIRIITILGTILCAFATTILYQPLFNPGGWYLGTALTSEITIPVMLMLGLPSVSLSFAPGKNLAAFPAYLKAYRLKQTVLFVVLYLLVAGLFFLMICVRGGFFGVVLALAALVVMFMFATGIGWVEDLVYDVFKGHPSEFSATYLYLTVVAMVPVFLLKGDINVLMIGVLTMPLCLIITQIGGHRNL